MFSVAAQAFPLCYASTCNLETSIVVLQLHILHQSLNLGVPTIESYDVVPATTVYHQSQFIGSHVTPPQTICAKETTERRWLQTMHTT